MTDNTFNTAGFIADLLEKSITLWAEDKELRFRAPKGILTKPLQEQMTEHKDEIIAFLGENKKYCITSFAQQRLFFLDRLVPDNPFYNIPIALRIKGKLVIKALADAFHEIVRRHEILRTTFELLEGRPVQVVNTDKTNSFPVIDLHEKLKNKKEIEAEAGRLITEAAKQLFDLSSDSMMRASLLKLAEEEYVLLITFHHIACDGWSLGVLFKEIETLYDDFTVGKSSSLPDLPIQYAAYSAWQREWLQKGELKKQLSFWENALKGAPDALYLPADFPRRPLANFAGAREDFMIPKTSINALIELSKQEGTTLFMAVLTVFSVLLQRYSRQDEIVVGSPIAGRSRSQLEGLIGIFVNQLALRVRSKGTASFRELLKQVREATLNAYDNQDLPFEFLVEKLQPKRDLSRNPIFQVSFALQDAGRAMPKLGDLELHVIGIETNVSRFDLELQAIETAEGISGYFIYDLDLFEKATICRMIKHFCVLFENMVKSPDQPISSIPLLTAEESKQMLIEWNQTDYEYPKDKCVIDLFEIQVEETPNAPAIIFEQEILSYRQLNEQANRLASYLKKQGASSEATIGICLEHCPEILVAILAILKCGCAYVPLDPKFPGERLAFMMEDSNVFALITEKKLSENLPGTDRLIICLDSVKQKISLEPAANLEIKIFPGNLAYTIYTSGSTGAPKGTLITHRGLINYLTWCRKTYPLSSGEGVLLHSSISFDLSITSIFAPLVTGRAVRILPEDPAADLLVSTILETHNFTFIKVTPAHMDILNRQLPPEKSAGLTKALIIGGENLTGESVKFWQKHAPDTALFNEYGPTETVVGCCVYKLPIDETFPGSVPIGRPIINTQLYILDERYNPVPVGAPGELYIAGVGLARGYRNRPDLTAERFVPNPFSGEPGARMYKTGDLVKYLHDGTIMFLERIDNQVKIRGYRIELGEIEAVLEQHPDVHRSVVLAREDEPGDKRLVAYILPDTKDRQLSELKNKLAPQLRSYLKGKLPEYMVPSAYMILDSFPLSASGKVDRRALPIPEGTRTSVAGIYIAPRNPIEEKLAESWQKILGIAQVGMNDNFFELGGHSLLAIQVMSDIAKTFYLNLPLRTLFESPTVAELAEVVARGTADMGDMGTSEKFMPLPVISPCPGERFQPFPLTDIQEAYWVGRSSEIELGNVSSHSYSEIDYRGLDLERYEQAWQKLIDHHDMLRVIIRPDGLQQVLEDVPLFKIKVYDFRDKDEETVSSHLRQVRDEMSHQVLPTDRWPIFEIRATLLAEGRLRLHASFDALTIDGWSGMVLTRELVRFYDEPGLNLPPLELFFRDYVLAEIAFRKSDIYMRSLSYWRERLKTMAPAPELPLATDPAALKSPSFERHRSRLDAPTWGRLKALAARHDLTPSIVLLSLFSDVLAVWSKNPRLTVNLTLFNRLPLHPQVNDIAGDFTTLTLLDVDRSVVDTFADRVRRVQNQLWEDLDHRYVSGVKVLREMARMQGGAPRALMPVVFTSTLVHGKSDVKSKAESTGSPSAYEAIEAELVYSITQTPQVWIDHHVSEREGALYFDWDSVKELFPVGMIDDMFAVYCELLNRAANDESAWREKTWPTIPQAQLELQKQVNDTGAPVSEELLHTLCAKQVEKSPNHPAVIFPDGSLTYHELNLIANQVGHWLQRKGVQRNRLVGVVMDKGWEQVPAVLGILNSGAAYLPIDPNLPAERIRYLMDFGELEIAITQPWLADRLAWPENISQLVIGGEQLAGVENSPLPVCSGVDDLAYVIFTSGSTGLPKGVMIDHKGAVNTILDINQRFAVKPQDRVLALSALNFDLSVYDFFGLLAAGGTIVMPESGRGRDPSHWLDLIVREQVTLWDTVPALMEILVEYTEANSQRFPDSLRQVFMSGDWIPVTLPDRIRALGKDIKVCSGGGATEASIWSISYPIGEVDPAWPSIPYGKPLVNQTFYVLDRQLEQRPLWVPGDLYIGGIGVALGYWRDKEKTDASFITPPKTGERLYRTGDMGLYLPDGNIRFLGREDLQVKIRGYRIELGEIEAALLQHPRVASGVVSVLGDTAGEKRLVAYIVPGTDAASAGETAAFHDYQPPQSDEIVENPLERLKFKMTHPGLRKVKESDKIFRLTGLQQDDATIEQFLSRRSYRKFKSTAISFEQMSAFLGCLSQIKFTDVPLPKYRYASAGGLYPVQVYLYVKTGRVTGLPGGSYYYDPKENRLVLLSAEAVVDPGIYPIGNRELFEQCAFAIYLVGRMKGILPMYGQWSRDFCILEAGSIAQLLEMSAPQQQIGLCQIGGFGFDNIRSWFALDGDHVYLHGLLGGAIDVSQIRLAALVEDSAELSAMLRLLEKESAASPETAAASVAPASPGASLTEELKDFLRGKIPEYMVPTAFVFLDELPLTANGKVDRKSLPELDLVVTREEKAYVEPETELEKTIAGAWQEVLGLEKVGVHDNIFDLGGSSFHIVQIHNKLSERLNKGVSLVKLFEYPTISQLTHFLSEGVEDTTKLEESESRSKLRRQKRGRRR